MYRPYFDFKDSFKGTHLRLMPWECPQWDKDKDKFKGDTPSPVAVNVPNGIKRRGHTPSKNVPDKF